MRLLATWLLGCLLVTPVLAGARLVLHDGTLLEGVDVRRDGSLYLLTEESGSVVTVPFEFVREVQLEQKPAPDPVYHIRDAQPETLAGSSVKPQHLIVGEPQVLAGEDIKPPRTAEQLAVLGPPSEFKKDIIDPNWRPTSDWSIDPEETNNFAPSKWSKSIIDNDWEPETSFKEEDVMVHSESRFVQPPIQSDWQPEDGFKKKSWN